MLRKDDIFNNQSLLVDLILKSKQILTATQKGMNK
jgi:hypothetical protein